MKRVYFIRRANGTGPIKIGCSSKPEERAKQLSSDMKEHLSVIASTPGTFSDERNLHLKLDEHRLADRSPKGCKRKTPIGGRSEWFAPTPEVLETLYYVIEHDRLPLAKEECREKVLAERYIAGATLQQIADEYGITRERVRQVLRKAGVPSLGHRPEHKRRAKPLTSTEEAGLDAIRNGERPSIVAERLGLNLARLNGLRVRAGIPAKGVGHWNRNPETEARAQEIAALYLQGLTAAQIVERIPALKWQPTVYRYLAIAGVKAQRRDRSTLNMAAVARAYGQGATLREIADQFGCTYSRIRRALERHGVAVTQDELERRRLDRVRATNIRRAQKAA